MCTHTQFGGGNRLLQNANDIVRTRDEGRRKSLAELARAPGGRAAVEGKSEVPINVKHT